MGEYSEAVKEMMHELAAQPRAVFIGQSVGVGGTKIYDALRSIPISQRIEFPVAEHTQLGVSIGMALNGDLPISVYPRWNFLLEATGMLVSHLDKIHDYSRGGYTPKVIIRTAIGSDHQLNPGIQHLGDYSLPFRQMLKNVRVWVATTGEDVRYAYRFALGYEHSTIVVERSDVD